MTRTAALVGAVGGAGATRLAVECGAALARDGQRVAVLDAALDTQGLRRHVAGDLDPDFAAALAGEAEVAEALVEHPESTALDGHLALAPVRTPFTRIAAAKTPDAGERVSGLLGDGALAEYDCALVDAPPVATNPAVGAVTAADSVALVAPDTKRGRDGVARERGRLEDVGAPDPLIVYNRAEEGSAGDHRVPPTEDYEAGESACVAGETPFGPAVASLAGELVGTELGAGYDDGLLSF